MIKKAQFSQLNIFTFMVTAILAVVLFAGMIWTMGKLNDVFTEVGVINEANANSPMYVNLSQASEDIWGTAYESIQALRMVSTIYILGLGFCIILVGALERKHPLLFFVYLLIILLAVIFAPTISNAYEELLLSGVFDNELSNFGASNFILLNLPTVTLFLGVLGAIFLFINLVRSGNEENIA